MKSRTRLVADEDPPAARVGAPRSAREITSVFAAMTASASAAAGADWVGTTRSGQFGAYVQVERRTGAHKGDAADFERCRLEPAEGAMEQHCTQDRCTGRGRRDESRVSALSGARGTTSSTDLARLAPSSGAQTPEGRDREGCGGRGGERRRQPAGLRHGGRDGSSVHLRETSAAPESNPCRLRAVMGKRERRLRRASRDNWLRRLL